jgi:hypothetical protein
MENTSIAKVYEIKSVGGQETYTTFSKINDLFIEMKKNKVSLNEVMGSNNSGSTAAWSASLKEVAAANKDLVIQLRNVINIFQDFGTVGQRMMAQITASMKQANMATIENIGSFYKFTQTVQVTKNAQQELEKSSSTLGQRLAYVKDQVAATQEQLKILGDEYRRNAVSEAEYSEESGRLTQQLIEQRNESQALTQILKMQAVAQDAVSGSINEARANSALYRKELNALNLTTEEGVERQQYLIAEIAKLDEFIKSNADLYTQQKINIGNYPTLGAEFAALKNEMLQLAAAGEQDSEEFAKLQERAMSLSASMKEVNASIKGASASGDRFGNIVERMGLRMIANLLIFQAAIDLIDTLADEYKASMSVINAEEEAAAAKAKEMSNSFAAEAATLITLKARFEDVASTESDKMEVVDELNEKFGNQIDKINGVSEAEKFFVDKSDAFVKALNIRAEATAAMNVIIQQYQKQLEATTDPEAQLSWFNKMGAALSAGAKNFKTIAGLVVPVNSGKDIGNLGDDIAADYDWEKAARGAGKADQTIQATQKQIDFLTKQFIDLQNQAQKLDSKYGFNTSNKGGKDKTRTQEQHDYFTTMINARAKELEIIKKMNDEELEEQANTLQAIYQDENQSLHDRLSAYSLYISARKQLLNDDKNAELSAIKEKMDKIADIEDAVSRKRSGKALSSGQQGYFDSKGRLRSQEEDLVLQKGLLSAQQSEINARYSTSTSDLQRGIVPTEMSIFKSSIDKKLKEIDDDTSATLADIEAKKQDARHNIYTQGGFGVGRKLGDTDLNSNIDADKANIAGNDKKQAETEDALSALSKQDQHNSAILSLEANLQNQLTDLKRKGIAMRSKLDDDNYQKDIDNKKNEKLIETQAFNVFESITNDYMQLLAKEDEYKETMMQRQMEYNKTVQDGEAQSLNQKKQNDKAAYLEQQQMDRQKMIDDKRRAEVQALLDYATASMKIFAEADDWEAALIEEVGLTAIFGAKEAMIASAPVYAQGGEVPGNGGVFGGRSHSEGGTRFLFKGGHFEAEADELAIINKRSAGMNTNMTVSGTPKQIASAINAYGGGYNFAPGAQLHRFEYGGHLGYMIEPPSFISEGRYSQAEVASHLMAMHNNIAASNALLHEHSMAIMGNIAAINDRIDNIKAHVVVSDISRAQNNNAKSVKLGTL